MCTRLLPAKTILFWITIILALGVLASMWLRSVLLPGIGFVALLVLASSSAASTRRSCSRSRSSPNASDKEAPYIARNIEATRDGVRHRQRGQPNGTVTTSVPGDSNAADHGDRADSDTTVSNIRHPRPERHLPRRSTTRSRSDCRTASRSTLDVDRYTVDRQTHDYIVGVREQVPAQPEGSQNNWINQHTVYTHGYGFVAAEADQDVTGNGDGRRATSRRGRHPAERAARL